MSSWSSEEAHEIGEISANVKTLVKQTDGITARVRVLEVFANRTKGIVAFLLAIAGLLAAAATAAILLPGGTG